MKKQLILSGSQENPAAKFPEMFLLFFKIGAFTIGGGYAMIPLIQKELIEKKRWVDERHFLDNLAVAQSIPGPIVVNFSLLTGYRLRGLPGGLFSLLGTVLPSFLIILLLAIFLWQYQDRPMVQAAFQGIRPAVVALIASAAYRLGRNVFRQRRLLLLFIIFIAVLIGFSVHPIAVITAGAAAGLFLPLKAKTRTAEEHVEPERPEKE